MTLGFSQSDIITTAKSLGLPTDGFVQRRVARAIDILDSKKVSQIDDGIFRVRSQYDPSKSYIVNVNSGDPSCDCPDSQQRTIHCKHRIASLLYQRQAKSDVKVTWDDTENSYHKRGRWWVTDYKRKVKYIVYRDGEGKLICPCGRKPDCEHRKAIREYLNDNGGGNGSKITRQIKYLTHECGSEHAKALQRKLNGQLDSRNGNGNGAQVPSQQPQRALARLDISDPFQECEQLDIDQIEGRLDGELVHRLSNGEYVISYKGIMTLAEKHNIEFSVSLHDDTNTVIAKAMNGNSRVSGKEVKICGFATTASELAKRNAARQLIPLPEIKALERKAKLENEFDWQKAKAKCVELVGIDANVGIIIHELVKDGKLRQDNPSHYNRKEWRIIYEACRDDASNDNDDDNDNDDGGDNPPSSNNREVRLCQVVWRGKTKSSVASCTSAREHRQEFGCVGKFDTATPAEENAIEFQNSLDPKFRKGSCIIDSKTGEAIAEGVVHASHAKVDPDDDNPPERPRKFNGRHGGNDDDGNNDGDNTRAQRAPADDDWKAKLKECKETALNAQRFDWLKSDLQNEGVIPNEHPKGWQDQDFSTLRQACELDSSLFNRALGDDFHIQKERNWGGYESSRRYRFWIVTKDTREVRYRYTGREELREKCFWCGKTKSQVELLGDDMIYWERYEVKISFCNECESTDTETLTKKFDELYHNGNGAVDTTGLPKTAEDFVKRCKDAIEKVRAGKEVEANEQPLEGDNGKRKLQMDKKLKTWLVETDGTKKEISCREICEQFESEKNPNIVTRLRAGIDSGADLSTVELD